MFWQEDSKEEHFTPPDTIQEASFSIESKILPIDHSYLLAQALLKHLPWLESVGAGIHPIGIHDGNGWEQDHKGGFYYPSRRSKLTIRIAKEKLNELNELAGKVLDLGDYQIKINKHLNSKTLSPMPVLFSKHVATDKSISEDDFLKTCYAQLSSLNINVKKMMAGLEGSIKTNTGNISTRSLMVANLKKDESVRLQEHGLGEYRLLGCGLFVPQKDIDSV